MKKLLLAALVIAATPAWALDVYKCGKGVFQSYPCAKANGQIIVRDGRFVDPAPMMSTNPPSVQNEIKGMREFSAKETSTAAAQASDRKMQESKNAARAQELSDGPNTQTQERSKEIQAAQTKDVNQHATSTATSERR